MDRRCPWINLMSNRLDTASSRACGTSPLLLSSPPLPLSPSPRVPARRRAARPGALSSSMEARLREPSNEAARSGRRPTGWTSHHPEHAEPPLSSRRLLSRRPSSRRRVARPGAPSPSTEARVRGGSRRRPPGWTLHPEPLRFRRRAPSPSLGRVLFRIEAGRVEASHERRGALSP